MELDTLMDEEEYHFLTQEETSTNGKENNSNNDAKSSRVADSANDNIPKNNANHTPPKNTINNQKSNQNINTNYNSTNNNSSYEVLVTKFTPYHQVTSFVKSLLMKVFPRCLWGSFHNLEQVFASKLICSFVKTIILYPSKKNNHSLTTDIAKFIRLRRYENMTLEEILQGFKVLLL